ncbi:MAG: hypothetical protein D6806_09585, partial [Deltaproteobacteria bacterium]
GTGCTDDGNVCTDDVCDGSGTCTHPPNTAPCDDGLWCTENDRCSGGTCTGEQKDCSYLSGPCYEYTCDEAADACLQGNAKDAGTECPPCGRCDGQGSCLPSADRAGDTCDDGDPCTAAGSCNGEGVCVIEGWCDEIVDETLCSEPAVTYGEPGPDCRLPDDKVVIQSVVRPPDMAAGGVVPIRLNIRNTPYNSRLDGPWEKALRELSLKIHLGRGVGYVSGSASLNGSVEGVREQYDENSGTLILGFDPEASGDLPVTEASAGWVVDMLVFGSVTDDAVFDVQAFHPCRAEPAEIGCHEPEGLQAVSAQLEIGTTPGIYGTIEGDAQQPEGSGCNCSAPGGRGVIVPLGLLLLALPFRKKRTI